MGHRPLGRAAGRRDSAKSGAGVKACALRRDDLRVNGPLLRPALLHLTGGREDAHPPMAPLSRIRNLVAHHEPVGGPTSCRLRLPGHGTWVADTSRVPAVLAALAAVGPPVAASSPGGLWSAPRSECADATGRPRRSGPAGSPWRTVLRSARHAAPSGLTTP